MGRPRKEEIQEDSYIKVQRVLGQKVTRVMDSKYFQEFPDIYEKLMRYNVVELPMSVFKELKGLKIAEVETEKVEE